ncbi:MAG: hypothetical protein ACU836_13385 [Gammaproteobacteria bacterium]
MKPLFFVLCLLNLAYFLWQFHNGRLNIRPDQDFILSSILLIDEHEAARRGALISGLLDARAERLIRHWQQADSQRMLLELNDRKRKLRESLVRAKRFNKIDVIKPLSSVKAVKQVKLRVELKPLEPIKQAKSFKTLEAAKPLPLVEAFTPLKLPPTMKPIELIKPAKLFKTLEAIKPLPSVEASTPLKLPPAMKPLELMKPAKLFKTIDAFVPLSAVGTIHPLKLPPAPSPLEAIELIESMAPSDAVSGQTCYLAGPFVDEIGARQWLNENALSADEIIQQEMAVPSDYQVYFPAAKTSEQSKADLTMLREKGIADTWRIPAGSIKGAYSLGVFKDRQRALTLQSELAAKGIETRIQAREKPMQQWFAKLLLDKGRVEQYHSEAVMLSVCRDAVR